MALTCKISRFRRLLLLKENLLLVLEHCIHTFSQSESAQWQMTIQLLVLCGALVVAFPARSAVDPNAELAEADRFAWLKNWTKAEPHFAQAEKAYDAWATGATPSMPEWADSGARCAFPHRSLPHIRWQSQWTILFLTGIRNCNFDV